MTAPAPDIAFHYGRLYLTRAACERHAVVGFRARAADEAGSAEDEQFHGLDDAGCRTRGGRCFCCRQKAGSRRLVDLDTVSWLGVQGSC